MSSDGELTSIAFRLQSSFRANGLSEDDAQSEVLFAFVAGSDTTASAMRATMLYIMSSPLVYNKLKQEIRSAILEGRASSPITIAEARELPYLQASTTTCIFGSL